ncbi:MAG: hypothetical protein GXP55_12790, partial [Deltaproteobacteria bacterium]|nr:hypothetical protein [Deltaproteobacteria bacterium]
WQTVAQGFGVALADQLNEDARITDASVTEGLMSVMLRSDFQHAVGVPDDRDRLGVRTGVHIARLRGSWGTDCRDLTFDVHFTVELEHTDRMQLPVQDEAFAIACRLGDELSQYNRRVSAACRLPGLDDSFWLDPSQTRPALSGDGLLSYCAFVDSDAQVFRNRVIHQAHEITSDLANGREVVCDPGARMFFSLDSSDWTLRRHRELSGRGTSHDTLLLLGLATMDGHDLGAHDTLARVLSVTIENFHDGPGGNCNPGWVSHVRKRNITKSIKGALRNSLPLALNAAFMSGAVQEPNMAAGVDEWRDCSEDADCDFRARSADGASLGPAFQTADGQWRGARHVCRQVPNSTRPDDRVCWPQIEIDRINVRPDGLEAVIEDDIDLDVDPQDPQATFAMFTPGPVRGQICSRVRPGLPDAPGPPAGGYLRSDLPPNYQSRNQFSFVIIGTSGSIGDTSVPVASGGS